MFECGKLIILGAVIIFTGLLSVAFLRMRLLGYKWLGMILVMFGLVIVGLCDIYESDTTRDINAVITGNYCYIKSWHILFRRLVDYHGSDHCCHPNGY